MEFLRDYPAEGGYTAGMSTYDKYHCWAATQYREKVRSRAVSASARLMRGQLTAALEGKDWSASPPSEANGARGPSPSQGLRKSRASTRTASSTLRQDSSSPARANTDHKTAKEDYFAALGASNASRPEHLAPSQGGRYTGFGSTAEGEVTSGPLPADPVGALSRGWSLFAGAVAGASRAVSENVVKPGMERVADPELRAQVGGYVSTAGQRAAAAAGSANAWGRAQFGVDVGESVGAVVDRVKTGVVGDRPRGYEAVGQWDGEEGSALYADSGLAEGASAPSGERADWDEWKEF